MSFISAIPSAARVSQLAISATGGALLLSIGWAQIQKQVEFSDVTEKLVTLGLLACTQTTGTLAVSGALWSKQVRILAGANAAFSGLMMIEFGRFAFDCDPIMLPNKDVYGVAILMLITQLLGSYFLFTCMTSRLGSARWGTFGRIGGEMAGLVFGFSIIACWAVTSEL